MSGQKWSTSCVIILRLTSPNPGNLWEPSKAGCPMGTVTIKDKVSNKLSLWGQGPPTCLPGFFWHVITEAPTAYHHLSKRYRSGNWTVKFGKRNFSFELLTSVWRPPEWQCFLRLMRLTNPGCWDVERVQNAWESMRRAESQLARGVHVLCKIQTFDNHSGIVCTIVDNFHV